jgi:hypothetical protein
MKENFTHDDILKQRLEGYESQVPDDMFERIMSQRALPESSSDGILKEKLDNYESTLPTGIFDRIMNERSNLEPTMDDVFNAKLADYKSPIPANMFNNVMNERENIHTQFDSAIQTKLDGYESTMPADMFERIMNERDNRKPVAAWWQMNRFRLAFAALLFLLSFGYWSVSNSSINKGERGAHTADANNQSDLSISDKRAENFNEKDKKEAEMTQSSISTSLNSNLNTINIDKETDDDKITGQLTDVYKSIKKAGGRNIKTATTASNAAIITANGAQQIKNPISVSPVIASSSVFDNTITATNSEVLNRVAYESKPIDILSDKGIIPNAPLHEAVLKALPCPSPDGCPTFGKKKSSSILWYLDAYVAPEYAMRNLKSTSNEYNDYLTARDTVEKSMYAFGAGVRATAMLPSGFLLRGGIVYAQTNEKFQKDSFGIGNIRYVVDKNPTTGQLDTVSIEVSSGFFRKTRYNHYRSFDFTIQGGYEYPLSDNLTLGLNAGVNFNIRTTMKATVLAQDLQPLVVSTSNTIYRTTVGTSVVGSVAAYWRLSYKWQLMVEPQVRYYLNPISRTDYVLNQKYINIGLNTGLRYRF